jgi:hypothetical protein
MSDPTTLKIEAMVKAAVEAVLGNQIKATKAAKAVGNTAPKATKDETDAAVIRAFKKAGYDSVTPRQDVQTYNRWLAQGYKVRTGEHSIKVKQFRLFHRKQVEPFSPSTETVVPLKPKKAKKAPAQPELPIGA